MDTGYEITVGGLIQSYAAKHIIVKVKIEQGAGESMAKFTFMAATALIESIDQHGVRCRRGVCEWELLPGEADKMEQTMRETIELAVARLKHEFDWDNLVWDKLAGAFHLDWPDDLPF